MNAGSITAASGAHAALSRVSRRRGRRARRRRASRASAAAGQRRAYGSKRSLRGIEAVAGVRRPRAVDAEAVELSGQRRGRSRARRGACVPSGATGRLAIGRRANRTDKARRRWRARSKCAKLTPVPSHVAPGDAGVLARPGGGAHGLPAREYSGQVSPLSTAGSAPAPSSRRDGATRSSARGREAPGRTRAPPSAVSSAISRP